MAVRTKASGHRRSVLLVGGAVTLVVCALTPSGLFDEVEHRSIDLRFEHAPRAERTLDSQIAFVDVDDTSVRYEGGGRWPWSRDKIALALDEIARAGARTVVLDLILDSLETDPRKEPQDGDRALAAAIAAAPSALAVDLGDEDPSSQLFDPESAKRSLLESEATRLLLQLERRDGHAPTAETLATEVREQSGGKLKSPDDDAVVESAVGAVLRGDAAWRALAPRLLAGSGEPKALTFSKPPFLLFAESARAAGFVNFDFDADVALRWVPVVRAGRCGAVLQFGVAAALLHAGVALDQVRVDPTALRIGVGASERTWPLYDGRLWLVWPRADASDPSSTPPWRNAAPNRCTLAFALNVAQLEPDVEWQRTSRREAAAEIATKLLERPGLGGEELLTAVRDETSFQLADDASGRAPTADEEKRLAPFREFRRLDTTIATNEATIAAARAKLADELRGKLVFVGWTATGAASDFVPTPLGPRTPGVVAHAVVADMIASGRALRFAPPLTGVLLTLLLGLLATEACLLPTHLSVVAVVALLAAHVGFATFLFTRDLVVVPLAAPLLAATSAWVGTIALRSALAQLDQRRITRQFKARVGPELVDFLVAHPDALSRTGEPREVTAFFSDLAGFTSLSEQLGAPETVALLNRCMSATTHALVANGAYVNKFLGDGLMAFWSAFRPDDEQATHACRGALAAQLALEKVVDTKRVQARMGIATGRVIVGDCGAPPLLHDYTAIGDAVNLASRLESANKQFGTHVLVDGRTRELVKDGSLRFRNCGRVVVVGQTTAVDLYELAPEQMEQERVELTERAIAAFRALRLDESAQLFRELDARFGPGEKLAAVHLAAIARALASEQARAAFDGVLHLEAK